MSVELKGDGTGAVGDFLNFSNRSSPEKDFKKVNVDFKILVNDEAKFVWGLRIGAGIIANAEHHMVFESIDEGKRTRFTQIELMTGVVYILHFLTVKGRIGVNFATKSITATFVKWNEEFKVYCETGLKE
jgi:hypothetical protein